MKHISSLIVNCIAKILAIISKISRIFSLKMIWNFVHILELFFACNWYGKFLSFQKILNLKSRLFLGTFNIQFSLLLNDKLIVPIIKLNSKKSLNLE